MSQHYQYQDKPFEEFVKSTKRDWIEKIRQEFPGKKSDKIVGGKVYDRLAIFPIYAKEDLPVNAPLLPRLKSDVAWRYHEYISLNRYADARQINHLLKEALNTGASGLDFVGLPDIPSETKYWQELLAGIQWQHCYISFYMDQLEPAFFDILKQLTEGREDMMGALYLDYTTKQADAIRNQWQALAKFISNTHWSSYQLIGIHSASLPYSYENVILELSYVLSFLVALLDYLTDQRIDPARLFQNLEITLTTQPNFYLEVAKYRALRLLLTQVAKAYQLQKEPFSWAIKGMSGKWNKTIYEPVDNILRNTTEAMAAIMGGCNALTLLPHDFRYQKAGEFGRRMARNISNILRAEAHLDQVDDLVAGSYFLENLTQQMVQKVWNEFVRIEEKGGFLQAMEQGILQKQWEEVQTAKQFSVRERQQIFTGATRYVNENESVDATEVIEMPELHHGPALFETIRLKIDTYVNSGNERPSVALLIFPEPTQAAFLNVRVSFVKDLLASAGLSASEKVMDESSLSDSDKQNVYILCGSTQFYDQQLPEWLKSTGLPSDADCWLAGLPEVFTQELQTLGIRGFIHLKTDVYAILLNIIEKKGILL